jgi:hypothetical protein
LLLKTNHISILGIIEDYQKPHSTPTREVYVARVPFQQLGIARGAHAMKSGI